MDFVEWVEDELTRREWSRADLARKSNLSPAYITRVLNREQNAGTSFQEGVAKAFNFPVEEVFRRAGTLPPQSLRDVLTNRALEALDELDDEQKKVAIRLLEALSGDGKKKVKAKVANQH